MPPHDWQRIVQDDLARLRDAHLYRQRRVVRSLDETHVECDGRRYVNFASNNYLGLSHHPRILEAAAAALRAAGAGSRAAPLITGYGPAHASAERRLAQWKGTGGAVLFPSGYQANTAAVQTLAAVGQRVGGVRFLLDKLAHASLVDAVRATGLPFRVFPHNHMAKLGRLLQEAAPAELQVVITESVFSMDGDTANLTGLAELKARHPFLLLLDEAHGSGVYGPAGAGYAAEVGLGTLADLTVLTLSKALGGIGGAICGSSTLCEAVVNYGRAYWFSTSIPPAVAAAAEAAVDVLTEEPGRQQRVRTLARRVRAELADTAFAAPAGESPIIPVILKEERAALEAARRLQDQNLWVSAVRPPTVPRGGSRLRVTLSSSHSDAEVGALIEAIKALPPPP